MLKQMGKAAKQASWQLAVLTSAQKDQALEAIADSLEANSQSILDANAQDMAEARRKDLSDSLLDRLLLNPTRLRAIIADMRQVCRLTDPVGQVISGQRLSSGLLLERRRVPLGVVGVIYESRPNVTVDVTALCLKTGNAVILRGGKETYRTNATMVKIIQQALAGCGLPANAVQSIENPDRMLVNAFLHLDQYVDMLIPRGGASLHKLCCEQSTIPVITGGIGICHIYVDHTIDFNLALPVIENAKTQRPSACNSLETLLVHQRIAKHFLPHLSQHMHSLEVTLHADDNAIPYLANGPANCVSVTEDNYNNEWLSRDLNVRVVNDLEQAVEHIRYYGTQHSDAILTQSIQTAERFMCEVDSSVVYVNASTRFTDGGQFGLGAEVAVSTQKLHARGPMGLEALTSYKWVGYGDNLIRP